MRSWASTPAATRRPSAMAQTTSDWPRETSPAANTRGTLVAPAASVTHVAARVEREAELGDEPAALRAR